MPQRNESIPNVFQIEFDVLHKTTHGALEPCGIKGRSAGRDVVFPIHLRADKQIELGYGSLPEWSTSALDMRTRSGAAKVRY